MSGPAVGAPAPDVAPTPRLTDGARQNAATSSPPAVRCSPASTHLRTIARGGLAKYREGAR